MRKFLVFILVLSLTVPSFAGTLDPAKLIAVAKKYLGCPYYYGGASPRGFDCSGFAVFVFKKIGKRLPRTADAMYAAGKPVKKKDLRVGDILFFQNTFRYGISHVGIYIGEGKFIHASRWVWGVRIDSLSHPYYVNHYYSACRIPEFAVPPPLPEETSPDG